MCRGADRYTYEVTVTLVELLAQSAGRDPTFADVEALRTGVDQLSADFFDRIALELAKRYQAGLVAFSEADAVANVLFAFAVQQGLLGSTLEQVFLAFDAGEFIPPDRPVDFDPETKYTRPRLAAIIQQAGEIGD